MAHLSRKLKAYVRLDGSGRSVKNSLVLRKNMPVNGKWRELEAWECCNTPVGPSCNYTICETTMTAGYEGPGAYGYCRDFIGELSPDCDTIDALYWTAEGLPVSALVLQTSHCCSLVISLYVNDVLYELDYLGEFEGVCVYVLYEADNPFPVEGNEYTLLMCGDACTTTTTTVEPTTTTTTTGESMPCAESIEFSDENPSYPTEIWMSLGTDTGTVNLLYNPIVVPDRFVVWWNGNVVIDTGYVSTSSGMYGYGDVFRGQLTSGLLGKVDPVTGNTYPFSDPSHEADGYPSVTTVTAGGQNITFNKSLATPSEAIIRVYAPAQGTAWNLQMDCPLVSTTTTTTLAPTTTTTTTTVEVTTTTTTTIA